MRVCMIKICVCLAIVLVVTEAAISTGRTYGTWVDRRRSRECQQKLICEYRRSDCMNNTPQNQWRCTDINNSMQAKMCTLTRCDETQGMLCLDADPGGNMIEVDGDTCALGKKCYGPVSMTTTPNTVSTNGTVGANNPTASAVATANTGFDVTPPETTTASFIDENATNVIWTPSGLSNSTNSP